MRTFATAILMFVLVVFVLCVGPGIVSASAELIVDIDVNDEVWLRENNLNEKDIRDLVTRLKENGCQTLMIRCGCMGILPYRTKLSYPATFDADHSRARPAPAMIPDMDAWISQRGAWMKKYAEVIHDLNPVEMFIKVGRSNGLKVIAWIDLFDDGNPGYRSKFLDEHPHCQWVARDGKTYFEGVMDYAWPEARAFRVAQIQELLDYGADGIHCSTSSHGRHMPNSHEEDFYGFSQPIVDAFMAQHGVDLRTAKEFDKAAWHDLKGEAMVSLYRDLSDVCHKRKKELWIGLQLGPYTQFAADPIFGKNIVLRYSNHWKKLVDQKIADAFILGDYEPVSAPELECWAAKPEIQRQNGEDYYGWAAREYKPYCAGRTQLFLFSQWMSNTPEELANEMEFWGGTTIRHGFDGIDMHEAWNFEAHPRNMSLLKRLSVLLNSKPTANP